MTVWTDNHMYVCQKVNNVYLSIYKCVQKLYIHNPVFVHSPPSLWLLCIYNYKSSQYNFNTWLPTGKVLCDCNLCIVYSVYVFAVNFPAPVYLLFDPMVADKKLLSSCQLLLKDLLTFCKQHVEIASKVARRADEKSLHWRLFVEPIKNLRLSFAPDGSSRIDYQHETDRKKRARRPNIRRDAGQGFIKSPAIFLRGVI